ncbi:DUF1542 domain-containing protein, partial [Streptococcus suis]|uniref:DUF1542 domain-containing protein n=3 Tax=Streptococcus suis TaxID=1307 RepID=UPI000A538E9D
MNRSKKKSFDWYGARQRFSIRKYHIGAASVLLGTTLVLGTGTIVGAETGVNGGGASNGQIVPGNGTGTSDGTQPQGDNQGVNSSGVQTGNTTNSTANDQSANDTGSASSQPVGTSRSANTGTQGDGSTNPTVDEPIIKFPTQANQTKPDGYQSVVFYSSFATLVFEGKHGETEIIRNGKPTKVVVFWVKTGTTWRELKENPQFRMPTYQLQDGDFILGYDRSVAQKTQYIDFDSLNDTPVEETWLSPTVDYIVGDVKDGKTFEEYMKSGYASFHIPQFRGITLNANGGTIDGKAKKAFYVAHEHVQWGNPRVTSKIDAASNKASRDGYTFVRWQTATGEGIPTSGKIETIEFTAVWLKHPEEKVAVFDRTKLTDSEKEQVKQKIYDANPDLSTGVAQVIKAIDISDTGEATVTFDDKVVTVPSTTLTNEDKDAAKSNAKAEIEKDATEKSDAINASTLTNEEKAAKLADVQDAKDRADIAIDKATTTEDLTKAISDGTAAIKAVSTTSTIKTKAKEALEEAYNAEKAEIENSVLTVDEKATKQAELTTAKEKAIKAVDDATTDSAVEGALNNGKATIESTYTAIIKIPSSASEKAPKGYVTVTFGKHDYTRGFTLGTQTGESVKVFVKENVKWGELLDDPAWQWPTVKTDEGDTVVGWSVNDYNYKPGNAFARDKYKDTVVTATTLYPNVVYEVEPVKNQNPTKQGFLAQYGPDEQNKWIFITFDAGQGQLSGSKQSKMVAVSKNLYSIDFSNKKFKEKVESPTLQGHTFVRWQTEDGVVLPESGKITTDTTYKALYLAHPTDKTVVFDANKLTETEKDSLKQAINNANTDSAKLIQSITVSDTGEATVTYNDGTVVTVPALHLINEDKEPARNLAKEEIDDKLAEEKAAIEAKRDAAIAEINNTPGLTDDQKQAATDAVTNTANDALTALDTAADDAKKAIDTKTTAADFNDAKTAGEKALDDAKAAGEAAINLTKDKELAKADVENQAAAAIEAIKNNPNLNEDEQAPYIDAIEKAAEEQKAAIDAAKDTVGITDAVNAAEKVNEEQKLAAAKQDAKNKIAKDVEEANAAIESNPNLTKDEIDAAKAAVADEAKKANDAIDAATTPEAVQAKEEEGTKAIAADVLDAAKQDAKNKIAKDLATVEAAIDANSNLTKEEKDAAKLAAQAKAAEAVANIEKATTPEAVQTLEDAAVKDLANIEIKAAYDDAVKAIEAADNLSTAAKTQALEDLKKARQAAEEVVKNATTADEVAKGALDGLKSIATVEATAAADDAKEAIAKNSNLTADEKKVYTD